MARKKKSVSKKPAAKQTKKTDRKVKSRKPLSARKKPARKSTRVKAPRKRTTKKNVTKETAKGIMKNVNNIKNMSMDDVKNYIAKIDVLDKLEELLLTLEKQIAVRIEKRKIIKKIT